MRLERAGESEKRTAETTEKRPLDGVLLSPSLGCRSKVTSEREGGGKSVRGTHKKRMRKRRTESDWRSSSVLLAILRVEGKSGFLFCAPFWNGVGYFSLYLSRSPLLLSFPLSPTIQFGMLGTKSFPIIPRFIALPTNLNGG